MNSAASVSANFVSGGTLRARVFVASYGSDSNPCTFGSPCKTLQQAVNVVAAGGEVTAIDSAGFGPIIITQAVTITSPDGVETGIVPTSGGNAITINAGPSDAVVLRGLTLNGGGIGYNGIVFNSGESLTINNCVAQNFFYGGGITGNGILIQPTSGAVNFTIINTTVMNNGFAGILYSPQSGLPDTAGAIDHVLATANGDGIYINGQGAVTVSNSIANNNTDTGIKVDQGIVSIDNVSVSGNNNGISAQSQVQILLGRSTITGNQTGILNSTSSNNFYTYADNSINENITDISGSLNTLTLQ
jgi:hypothetical protein